MITASMLNHCNLHPVLEFIVCKTELQREIKVSEVDSGGKFPCNRGALECLAMIGAKITKPTASFPEPQHCLIQDLKPVIRVIALQSLHE